MADSSSEGDGDKPAAGRRRVQAKSGGGDGGASLKPGERTTNVCDLNFYGNNPNYFQLP